MKTLITYYSETGNTEKVAEAISEAMLDQHRFKGLEELEPCIHEDLIFLGFPIHQQRIPNIVIDYLPRFLGKKLACFITHTMPTEAPLFQKQIKSCISTLHDFELLGVFCCRGELLLNHPDSEELQEAKDFAKKITEFARLY